MTHPSQLLTNYILEICNDLDLKVDSTNLVSATKSHLGDYASSVALQCASDASKAPIELAEQISERLQSCEHVAEANAAAPGFVNIVLTKEFWCEWANNSLIEELRQKPATGQKVNLEFVSANPTGPLVLVNAWQAFYGDVLARIFTQQGFETSREYYSNDAGSQIEHLGKSIQASCGASFSQEETEQFYKGEYIDGLAQRIAHIYGDPEQVVQVDPYEIGQKASEILFEQIKHSLKRIDVHYDRYFSEGELDLDGTLQKLLDKDAIIEKEGATWLKKEIAHDEKDRVLIRSNNQGPTYFFKDIAYQMNRLVYRGFDRAITIVGADHHAESQYLAHTLEFIGVAGFVPLTTQTVRLVRDGVEVKMSKRAGEYVALDDFLEQVPVDVARFYFASRDISSHIDINLDQLIEKSKNNPVFYTMYAYVRANSILASAKQKDFTISHVNHDLSEREKEMMRQFAQISPLLSEITQTYKVSSLFILLQNVARTFHSYYEEDRILSLDNTELRSSKLGVISQFANTMQTVYQLLGITALDKM